MILRNLTTVFNNRNEVVYRNVNGFIGISLIKAFQFDIILLHYTQLMN